ncbi:MAG: hypothetical protein JW714_02860 [Candidatus Omnitrophica bacterium]|nr:hypothetical protein [Candidatus Omnitrophota bacterium]
MTWVIVILGYLVIALCGAILAQPQIVRRILGFFSIGSRIYLAGLIRLVLGIILLSLAAQTRLWWYVVAVGLISSAAGLSIFFFALKRSKKLLKRLQNQSNLILRLYAVLGLVIWAILIYALLP